LAGRISRFQRLADLFPVRQGLVERVGAIFLAAKAAAANP